MSSLRPAICMFLALCLGSLAAPAQQPRKPTPEEDIRATRQMVEEQAIKLEAINQQVAKLAQQLSEIANMAAAASKSHEAPSTSATPSATAPSPAATPALATGTNPVHVVTKGETLTSIARHAKVSLAEILKLNKIENDRALQIGQTLILPAHKTQETPPPNEPE